MLNKKGIRVKYYTIKENNKPLPIGKIFMIIDRKANDEVRKGKQLFFGCQLTSSDKQKYFKKNIKIIEETSQKEYYIKGNQIYSLNIDLDKLLIDPHIDVDTNITFSDSVIKAVEKQIEQSYKDNDIKHYDSVEDIVELMKKVPNQKYILG
ncbi:MAG: hypothetical protein ACK5HR_01395 [Mycoplasmatales bacterium]